MQATSSETHYQSHVTVLPTTAGLAWIIWCHGDDGDETDLMTSWRLVIMMTMMVVIVRRRRRRRGRRKEGVEVPYQKLEPHT